MSDDTISRQAAIDALDDIESEVAEGEGFLYEKWRKYFCELPSAQPERKKGKWIEHNPHKWGLGIVFECSECGEKIDCEPSNFCPNCGARIEGQE